MMNKILKKAELLGTQLGFSYFTHLPRPQLRITVYYSQVTNSRAGWKQSSWEVDAA